MKIKVGDTVKVSLGKDRGKTGKVEAVFPRRQSVIVTGANLYKRHFKRRGDKAGEAVERPRPLAAAKVALLCPHCHQPTRVGYLVDKKAKVRICRKCGEKL